MCFGPLKKIHLVRGVLPFACDIDAVIIDEVITQSRRRLQITTNTEAVKVTVIDTVPVLTV